jgi:hypothetical protein
VLREAIRKGARGRDPKTPLYLQFGVIGVIGLIVIVMLAIVFPLYYAYGGK